WFTAQKRLLNELYDEITYEDDFTQESLIKYFEYKNERNTDIIEYYIAFADNYFVRGVGIWKPEGDYNVLEKEWYINALKSEDIEISSPYVDANHGEIIVTLSKAIKVNNEVIGVLCSDISIDHIVNIINESDTLDYGYSFLVDNNNNVLVHPNREFMFSKEKGMTKVEYIYNDITNNQSEYGVLKRIVDYDGKEKFLVYNDLGFSGWHIGSIAPIKEVMKPLHRIIDGTVALTVVLIIISFVLTFVFGNTVSKPIKVAKEYIEQMSKLDITQEIDKKYLSINDEIGIMFLSFQNIIDSLRDFLNGLSNISNKISTFSDELASLSVKSSIDADNMAENTADIAGFYDEKSNKTDKIINSLESLKNNIFNTFIEKNTSIDESSIKMITSMINETENLINDLSRIKQLHQFEYLHVKNTNTMIEKHKIIMEEISSASQCLAELGEELNDYISRFKK
ncbi:MAG TPA: methyl-accepting chemotaxis protein, partial [Tissierellia bacterium]|nr:methyl-accepting chemotaxis protein [Tissierellia bacterium]